MLVQFVCQGQSDLQFLGRRLEYLRNTVIDRIAVASIKVAV